MNQSINQNPPVPASVPSTELQSISFKVLAQEQFQVYHNAIATRVQMKACVCYIFQVLMCLRLLNSESFCKIYIELGLFCAAALCLHESLAYAVLSAMSFGHCYNLYVSDVCHEVFITLLRRLFQPLVCTVSDCWTYMNILTQIENRF